jgi:hypothetical protein
MVYMVVENFVDKMIKLVVIALNTMNQQLYWVSKAKGPTSTNEGGTTVMNATTGHVMKGTKILANQ